MKIFNKKNVLEMQDGSKHKINSPIVNDILNGEYDDAMKLEMLKKAEADTIARYMQLGDNVNNYTKKEFLGYFGALLGLSTYGIISSISGEMLITLASTIGVTGLLLYAFDGIAEAKNYVFTKSTDAPTFDNMNDFGIAKEYITSKNNDLAR